MITPVLQRPDVKPTAASAPRDAKCGVYVRLGAKLNLLQCSIRADPQQQSPIPVLTSEAAPASPADTGSPRNEAALETVIRARANPGSYR